MTARSLPIKPETWTPAVQAAWRKAAPGLRDFLVHVLGQGRVLGKAYPGIMHLLLFWGVTIQVVGTAINLMQMQLFIPFVELPLPRGGGYLAYELVMDLAGVAILIGVGMAFFRRLVLRPKTLETRWDDIFALVLLTLIPLAGFTMEGLRLRSVDPTWANWSPVGKLAATLFQTNGLPTSTAAALHPYLFWTHVVLGLAFIASIPFTKLRHLFATPLHIILHSRRKGGALTWIDNIEETEQLGVGKVAEFRPTQLLSFDACLNCGRCEASCPVNACGVDYSPRKLVQSLRTVMQGTLVEPNGYSGKELLEILPETLPWSCTTCGACLVGCPAFVNPVDEIIDLRRYQVLTTGKMPRPIGDVLRNLERQGNPWGMRPEERLAWADGLDVREIAPGEKTDVLWFLGCAFAYDARNRQVAQAFAKVLQHAGVDFAVMGLDEVCCGEGARRMGHEYLFQMFAEQNIDFLSKIEFNRIVTQCPHCFNTLKNEYPQAGGNFKVQHYTEYLAELGLDGVRPTPERVEGGITYHDPCYLARYNQVCTPPRDLLGYENIQEMDKAGMNSFCCGGGGGQMWMESDPDKRLNLHRLEQALETGAQTVATACPYCMIMFDDAIRSKGLTERIQVKDIAELAAESLLAVPVLR